MEMWKWEARVLFAIALLLKFCNVIPTGYETYDNDITARREYGCRWYGGSSSRVSCNCADNTEMFIQRNSIPAFSTTEIEVIKCKSVRFGSNSIAEMRNLRSISLRDIDSVIFDEESINWFGYKDIDIQHEERFDLSTPSLKVTVYNSNISTISSHAFRGRINEIIFKNVSIEKILPVAFANLLQTEKIAIQNSVLKNIDLQSFKKFSTENLELEGVTVDLIPSRAFNNVTVYKRVLINNCTFNVVRSGAFSIYNPEVFQVMNSNIAHLSGEAFKITSRGTVLFRNNTFNVVDDGAFRGIVLRRDELLGNPLFTFDSNTFSTLTRDSLSVSYANTKFVNIYINESCDCKSIDHKIKQAAYYTDIMCLYNEDYMVVKDFKSNMCSIISNYYIIIIIACVVTALFVIVVSALLVYYKFVYRSKKYGSGKQSQKAPVSLIVPDGRTYRETELHVILEKTDLLTTDL